MVVLVLTQAEELAALLRGSSELKHLLAREDVSIAIQAKFYHTGVTTLSRFAKFCKDDDEMRKLLCDDFGLDVNTSLAARSEVCGILGAFETARTRNMEVAKHAGEMDARQLTKPLLGSEYLILRRAFETLYGQHEDCNLPARLYLEKRISELEGGDLRAELLTTVLSREQDGEETLLPAWDITGAIRLKKSVADIPEPGNPEELRKRLGVMFNGLIMIAMQHTNRSELQGFTTTFIHSYAEFLLGEHCWGMIVKDAGGLTVATPSWGLILTFEHAVRKKAYKTMQETGRQLHTCMREAWLDPLVYQRSFTTPLALTAATGKTVHETSKASYTGSNNTGSNHAGSNNTIINSHVKIKNGRGRGQPKGQGGKSNRGKGSKGNSKNSGRGFGKGGLEIPAGCAARTPDGKALCYGYNDANVRCRKSDCSFLHLCGRCFQKHPIYACSGNRGAPQAETQGAGV